VEQASPHCGSGLRPAHGGGKASSRAIVVGGGKQRNVGVALTGENMGGGCEHRRRWPAKGNGSEDDAACVPTGDDGGGGSDRGGATTRGRRQLDGFISRTEIDVMTCGGQVGDDTHRQARRRSQPMTGGPMAGYFQTQNRL
jgi:hypothetical protein